MLVMNTEMKKNDMEKKVIIVTNIKSKSLGVFEVSEDLLRRQVDAFGIALVSHDEAGTWKFALVSLSRSSALLCHHLPQAGIPMLERENKTDIKRESERKESRLKNTCKAKMDALNMH